MQGLSFPDYPFAELFAPLLPEFDLLFWKTSFQQSPLPWEWREANAEWLESIHLEVFVDGHYSVDFWRPGALSILAPVLGFDEWSQMTGFVATDPELAQIADEFRRLSPNKANYFDLIEKMQGIFIVWVDGWWEVYTPHQRWLGKLNEHHQGKEVSSENFGSNYPNRATI